MEAELNKVVAAVGEFYARETYLFEKDLGERTMTHRLAVHIEKQFPGWDVDCDYDRLGGGTRRPPRPARGPTPAAARGDDRLDRRSPRKIGLSRHRGAPARDSR